MKKGLIFWMCAVLLLIVGMTACDNDDNPVNHPVNVNLYGEWMLQGYGSDSNFTDAVHGHLILKEDGTFEGGIVNELFGTYTFNSNGEFTITECWGTEMYSGNSDYNFMEEQFTTRCKIKSFRLLDNELRLYYSSDEYLKFLKNNDFSKAIGVRWRLHGFGTVGEDEVQEVTDGVNALEVEKNYTIKFMDDGTIDGYTIRNDFFGEYSVDGNAVIISNLCSTMVMETSDGFKYMEALPSVSNFEIRNDQLLLYYNDRQNYLLFDKCTDINVLQIQLDDNFTVSRSVDNPHGYRGENKISFSCGIKDSPVFDLLTISFEGNTGMDFFYLMVGDTYDYEKFRAEAFYPPTWTEDVTKGTTASSGQIKVIDERDLGEKYIFTLKLQNLKLESIDKSSIYTVNGTIEYVVPQEMMYQLCS